LDLKKPSRDAYKNDLIILLADLHKEEELPGISLEKAEERWHLSSPEWKQKLMEWDTWKAQSKQRERAKEKAKKHKQREDDEKGYDRSGRAPLTQAILHRNLFSLGLILLPIQKLNLRRTSRTWVGRALLLRHSMRWVDDEFNRAATKAYDDIGTSLTSVAMGWAIFEQMCPLIVYQPTNLE